MEKKDLKSIYTAILLTAAFLGSSLVQFSAGIAQISPYRILILIAPILLVLTLIKREYWRAIMFERFIMTVAILIIWLLYGSVSYFWVEDRRAWFKGLFFLAVGILSIITILVLVRERHGLDLMLSVLTCAVFIINILAWYELFSKDYHTFSRLSNEGDILKYSRSGFPVLWFGNTNNLAFVLTISFFFVYVWMMSVKRLSLKVISFLILVSSTALIFQSTSRGALIGLMTGMTLLLLYQIILVLKRVGSLASLFIAVLVFIMILPLPQALLQKKSYSITVNRLANIVKDTWNFNFKFIEDIFGNENTITKQREDSLGVEESINAEESIELEDNYVGEIITNLGQVKRRVSNSDVVRSALIINSFSILQETHYLGTGAGNLEHWMLKSWLPKDTKGYVNAHNFWIELLASYGVIVFLLLLSGYVCAWILFIYYAFKCQDLRDRYLAVGMLAMLSAFVIASISPSSIMGLEVIWPLMGIALASLTILRRVREKDEIKVQR